MTIQIDFGRLKSRRSVIAGIVRLSFVADRFASKL